MLLPNRLYIPAESLGSSGRARAPRPGTHALALLTAALMPDPPDSLCQMVRAILSYDSRTLRSMYPCMTAEPAQKIGGTPIHLFQCSSMLANLSKIWTVASNHKAPDHDPETEEEQTGLARRTRHFKKGLTHIGALQSPRAGQRHTGGAATRVNMAAAPSSIVPVATEPPAGAPNNVTGVVASIFTNVKENAAASFREVGAGLGTRWAVRRGSAPTTKRTAASFSTAGQALGRAF